MLKQLRANIMLEAEKRKLAALMEQQTNFATRKADIEKRLAEAAEMSDEDLDKINNDLTALEKEVGDANIDEKIKNVESEITRIEAELEEITKEKNGEGEKKPAEGTKGTEENRSMEINISGMNIRKIAGELVKRDEVKDWLSRMREFKGVTRAVTNAEINIPEIVLDPLRQIVESKSKLIKYLSFKRISGKARQPIVGTVPEAVWEEMTGVLNELEFGFNVVEADGYKVAGFIPVPNSLLEDSDVNLAVEVIDMLGKAIAYSLDKAIMYGEGVKMPFGIVPRLKKTTAPRDLGSYAPTYTDLTSHIGYLSSASLTAVEYFQELATGLAKAESRYAAGGKFWAMSEKTWAVLQTKLLSINSAGALTSAANMTMPIIGGNVELLDFMPNNVIAGGYGSLYLLVERQGGTITRSEHVQFIQDNTVFKGVARYDGLPVIGEGFAMFTLATSEGVTELDFAEDTANPNDAYLTALSVKNGGNTVSISPTFDKDVLSYTASVANGVSSVTVSGTARVRGKIKAIKVGGDTAAGGVCSLSVGANTVTVTTKYGTSERTYTIVITRAAS